MSEWKCPACAGDHQNDYLGASDAPAILGLSPWATANDVYRAKVGEAGPDTAGLPAYFGLAMERPIADLYEEETGVRLRKSRRLERIAGFPFLGTHLDYTGAKGLIVEIKTAGSAKGWGEAPDGEVPPHYWAQVQHQMMVMGRDSVDIAAVIRSREFRRYTVPRDDAFIAEMRAELERFWWTHIEPHEPPEVDGTERTRAWLASQHPDETGDIRPATAEQQLLVQALRESRDTLREAKAADELLANRIREVIGDDSGLRGEGFTITWKRTKDGKPVTDWQAVAAAYREILGDFWAESQAFAASLDDLDAIESLHTGPGRPGTRRLDVRFKETE